MTTGTAWGPGGRMRGAALLVVALLTAGAVARDALVVGLARAQPEAALRLAPTNPVALDDAFRRSVADGAPTAPELRRWARRARAGLRDAPLSAALIRMVATDPGRADTDRLLHLAESVSRRDAFLQLALIETAVRANSIGETLSHYDRALSVYPDLRGVLFPVLTDAATDPAIRAALRAPSMVRRPWMIPFVSYAVAHAASPATAAALLEGMSDPRGPAVDVRDQEAALAGRFLGIGDYPAARATAGLAAGADAAAIDRAGFSPGTWSPALRPLAWTPGGTEGIDAQLEQDGSATVTAAPGASGTALLRIMVVAPGRYRFGATSAAAADGMVALAGRWTLSCLRDRGRVASPLADMVMAPAGRSTSERVVDVPPECGAVRIVFGVDNLDGATEAALVLRDVAFAPVR